MLERAIPELELGVWNPPDTPSPIPEFTQRYGPYGEKLRGWLVTPLRDGRGGLLGFEGRNMAEKEVSQFKLPRAFWNPVFVGLRRAMPKIWAGGDVWIGEGLFDLTALDHIVPERDATLAALTAKLNGSHVEFLRRFMQHLGNPKTTYTISTVHMVFDRDEKGRKSTKGFVDDEGKKHWGAIESLDRVKVRCRDVYYTCPPGCKDPGDLWERFGEDGLRNAFNNSL